jgi:hypothetical protein
LLGAEDADFLPYIALIAFGGVPQKELHKGALRGAAIDFERGTIIIPAAIAKTGRKRKLDMAENLAEWLARPIVESAARENVIPATKVIIVFHGLLREEL